MLIDDHALFREGLGYVLDKLDDSAEILEAPGYEPAMDMLRANPDVRIILLDLNLPGKDGFTVLHDCLDEFPDLPVVILSGTHKKSDMQRVMDMGAAGFIAKDTTSEVMLSALKMVLAGGYYIPPALLEKADEPLKSGDPNYLTTRQQEVLCGVCDGLTNKEIAQRLGIAEATIKMHVTSIFSSLGVSNRTQLVKVAQELELL